MSKALDACSLAVHAKKVKGVGLGNIFGGGPMALRTTLSVDDGTSEAPSSGEPALTSPRDLGVQSEVVTPVVPESGDATRKFPAASRPEEDRVLVTSHPLCHGHTVGHNWSSCNCSSILIKRLAGIAIYYVVYFWQQLSNCTSGSSKYVNGSWVHQ